MLAMGVDPGLKGALSVIDQNRNILFMQSFDEISLFNLTELITETALRFRAPIFKEQFASFGVDGKTTFTVGRQHGAIDLAIYQAKLRLVEVTPKQWQKEVHTIQDRSLKPKYLSFLAAKELFPDADFRLTTKRGKKSVKEHDGLIDSVLIALYGIKFLERELVKTV
jgi:hypothetical protein